MFNNSFGCIKDNDMIINRFSSLIIFNKKNVSQINVHSNRVLHYNFLSFFIAFIIVFFIEYTNVLISILCVFLLVFSFFLKKNVYQCRIIYNGNLLKFKINKEEINDAELLFQLFSYNISNDL
jgi:hypothetical protein